MITAEEPRINGVGPPSWLDAAAGGICVLLGLVFPLILGAQILELLEVWALGIVVVVLCLLPAKWWITLLALPAGYWPASHILGVHTGWALVWHMAYLSSVLVGGNLYYLRMARKNATPAY